VVEQDNWMNGSAPAAPHEQASLRRRLRDRSEAMAARACLPGGDAPDDDVGVPGFLPNLPGIRHEYREYRSSSRRCDVDVAAVLGALDAAGAGGDTLVVFLSDNGIAVPFA
jgi:N-sulfoglucosamine sulfohydrolase